VSRTLITKPGAYPDIPAADYHGREICPTPSISSTGLKTITERSPLHYRFDSPLNPDREPENEKRHFRVGRALHDMVLLDGVFGTDYHLLPQGFSRAAKVQQAEAIAAADAATAEGKTLLSVDDAATVRAMAKSLLANPFAKASLTYGEPEVTLAWQDEKTGVWLRARPDFLPAKRRYIPDLKTAADASPAAFAKAISSFGYHQSAALYLDGIKAVFGDEPEAFFYIVVEKTTPYITTLYQLDAEDIDRGRDLNRMAIDRFAACLKSGHWPGYGEDVMPCGLTSWARKIADERIAA
jgi:hypothetical protein